MPNILRPKRQDAAPLGDGTLVALLAGTEPPADPGPGLQPVADLLAALRADPTSDELAGEASALEEFRRGTAVPASPHLSRHRRPRAFTSRLTTKAAAVGLAVLSLGGLTTAAFAGVLPTPIQRLAHEAMGALPAPHHPTPTVHQSRSHAPASPKVAESTVQRLCAAYAHAIKYGTAAQQNIAFHNLIKAIRGAGKITARCGTAVPGTGRSGTRPSHDGKRVPPGQGQQGNHHKQAPPGQQHKNVTPGQQDKGSSPGQQNQQNEGNHRVPPSQQNAKGNPPGQQNKTTSNGNPADQQSGRHGTHPHHKLSASHPGRDQHHARTHADVARTRTPHATGLHPARS